MKSIFETLMNLPLFKGVSKDILAETVGKFRFNFKKYQPGDLIAEKGENSRHVKFIISGSAECVTLVDGKISVKRTIGTNSVVFPEFLFGRTTCIPADITAIEPTATLEISKMDYIAILASNPIFLFNFLNFLSLKSQASILHAGSFLWGDILAKVTAIIDITTLPECSGITISTATGTLPAALDISTEAYISKLAPLKAEGVIDFTLNAIKVYDRGKLLESVRPRG